MMDTDDIQECCKCGVLYTSVVAEKGNQDGTEATVHEFDYSKCPVCKALNDKQ